MSGEKVGIEKRIEALFAKLSFSDVAEASIYAGLSYLSWDKLHLVFGDAVSMLWGPVALKLATSGGGGGDVGVEFLGTGFNLPCNSQTAGLAMLATIGFASLPWGEIGAKLKEGVTVVAERNVENVRVIVDVFVYWGQVAGYPLEPVERIKLNLLHDALTFSIFVPGPLKDTARDNLVAFCDELTAKYKPPVVEG